MPLDGKARPFPSAAHTTPIHSNENRMLESWHLKGNRQPICSFKSAHRQLTDAD